MCTVSVVAGGDRLRVMCNRDERHTRPDAHPPVAVRTASGLALMPIDPQGGGTWVAATGTGLVFALLNETRPGCGEGPSRGRIILDLLDATSADDAIGRARGLCWRGWPPHRLLVVSAHRLDVLRLGREGLGIETLVLTEPRMYTSSSLGDDLAGTVRRRLFDELVVAAAHRLDGQDAFHRHRWPDRPQVSVHMRRHDAATQSMTTVDVTPGRMAMRYEPVRELAGEPAWLSIPRAVTAAPPAAALATLALVS